MDTLSKQVNKNKHLKLFSKCLTSFTTFSNLQEGSFEHEESYKGHNGDGEDGETGNEPANHDGVCRVVIGAVGRKGEGYTRVHEKTLEVKDLGTF